MCLSHRRRNAVDLNREAAVSIEERTGRESRYQSRSGRQLDTVHCVNVIWIAQSAVVLVTLTVVGRHGCI